MRHVALAKPPGEVALCRVEDVDGEAPVSRMMSSEVEVFSTESATSGGSKETCETQLAVKALRRVSSPQVMA